MMSSRYRALCRYARKVTLTPSDIEEQDIEEMRDANFSDREIVDANGIIAYYNYANRVASGLGVGVGEESCLSHLDKRYSIDAERYRDLRLSASPEGQRAQARCDPQSKRQAGPARAQQVRAATELKQDLNGDQGEASGSGQDETSASQDGPGESDESKH